MRLLIVVSILGIAALHHQTLLDQTERLGLAGDSAEVKAALQLRCGEAPLEERQHCETDLRAAFASGTSDADAIVRLHCTRFENGWVERQTPSPVCATVQEG